MKRPAVYSSEEHLNRELYTPHDYVLIILQHIENRSIMELTISMKNYSKVGSLIRKYTHSNLEHKADYFLVGFHTFSNHSDETHD